MQGPTLNVVMYHYVRDLARTKFPGLKAMDLSAFRKQVDGFRENYEMASLESALAFLAGQYQPRRPMCLLTFDDGVKEHYSEVTPLLASRGIEGLFFIVTGCIESGVVAAVHKNHFLTAELGFAKWRKLFLDRLLAMGGAMPAVDAGVASRTYPWDEESAAQFKYFFNFLIPAALRDRVVADLFSEQLGDEGEFARNLYVSWAEAKQMQAEGMVLGGHTNTHRSLSSMDPEERRADLRECRRLLDQRVKHQYRTPFSYPYGKRDSFTQDSIERLCELNFCCAFSTEMGANQPGTDPYVIQRVDCNRAA